MAKQFEDMPDEILLRVFSYLDVQSISRAKQVSRRWYEVSSDITLIIPQIIEIAASVNLTLTRNDLAGKNTRAIQSSLQQMIMSGVLEGNKPVADMLRSTILSQNVSFMQCMLQIVPKSELSPEDILSTALDSSCEMLCNLLSAKDANGESILSVAEVLALTHRPQPQPQPRFFGLIRAQPQDAGRNINELKKKITHFANCNSDHPEINSLVGEHGALAPIIDFLPDCSGRRGTIDARRAISKILQPAQDGYDLRNDQILRLADLGREALLSYKM